MKLVSFDDNRVGVVVGDSVVDLSDLVGAGKGQWPPVAMTQLIAEFARLRPLIEAAAQTWPSRPLSKVRLATPIPWPSKIIAYPVNYHEHGVEMGREYRANTQGFFLKPPSSLSGPNDPIVLPMSAERRIDHECELGIVIGKTGRDVPREGWRDYVFGYTLLIDAVIRGKEERVARKAFDSFCPVGPWIVTADELGDYKTVELTLKVNDQQRQNAQGSQMIFDIPTIIESLSAGITLEAGDIIITGTPQGVGFAMDPPQGLHDGDVMTLTITRIGELQNTIREV